MSRHLRAAAGARADLVHLLGHQPPEGLFPAVAAADIVVMPSLWEAFGIVALEAMALGRPIVASAAGGLRELVRDGRDGVLVPPDDPSALAGALMRLLGDHPLRERLGASARGRAEEFAPAAIAARFAECVREVSGTRS
jgi:glycosyltransferase involved in cell wall biosynthesis